MNKHKEYSEILRNVEASASEIAEARALMKRLKPQIDELVEAGRTDLLTREVRRAKPPLSLIIQSYFYDRAARALDVERDLGFYFVYKYEEGRMRDQPDAVFEDLSDRLRALRDEPHSAPETEFAPSRSTASRTPTPL